MPSVNVSGDKINYVRQGEQGLAVLFVHGAGSSHLIWWNQVRALAPLARAVALDLPGHGRSSPGGRESVVDYAQVVLGVMDALAFDRAVIVGHSMGGAIAQTVALSHPDRIVGLGLVGTGARLRVLPSILEGILNDPEQTAHMITQYSFAPGAEPALLAKSEEQLRACPPIVTHGDFRACNEFDIMGHVAEVRAPTLIICGRQDRMTPVKYSEFLASKVPGAQIVLIEGAGHYVMLERPEQVNRALVDWVRTVQAPGGKPS
jgi:pimeloyl-ACP methyl ester carboxylesterase